MKIRSDFVTNSSSSSTTEIVIDNPVLLQILQKYKDMGVISEIDNCEDNELRIGSNSGWIQTNVSTPAFSYYETQGGDGWTVIGDGPEKISDLLDHLIDALVRLNSEGSSQWFQKLNLEDMSLWFQKMIAEIKQNRDSINANYRSVRWLYKDDTDSSDVVYESLFTFDPVNGEKFTEKISEYDDEDDWEDNDEDDD